MNLRSRKTRMFLLGIISLLFILACVVGMSYYRDIFGDNIRTVKNAGNDLYIPTGASFSTVEDSLITNKYLINKKSFEWLAIWKKYPYKVKPGRYRIVNGMSNNQLLNLLISGKQVPVMVVFNNIRTKRDLAYRIGSQIEADSVELLNLLNNPEYLEQFNATPASAFILFIPNSYEFYWNTSADQFVRKMYREQKKFWNDGRVEKISLTGLTIPEVITLASIVEKETNKNSEKPVIAGVYMNRLQKGWPLQADPTLIFAVNDYSIHRVMNYHKSIESPYNTYLHTGLPPGPICLPSVASIDAVLNYRKHGFMYFCAKEDLSGYHRFAETISEHLRNAAKYQRALNKMNIR